MQSITHEVSEVLTRNTDEALQDGACGLPWFRVTNVEGKIGSFCGFDHLLQIIDFVDLQRNTDKPLL